MHVTCYRIQPVVRGTVMRRSCRLSTKHEHRLLKQAEADAAETAAAEAAAEGISVYPSTVTKAIAGLATPSLPSPSMFPEDWRMVEELLHDTQVAASHPQIHQFHWIAQLPAWTLIADICTMSSLAPLGFLTHAPAGRHTSLRNKA